MVPVLLLVSLATFSLLLLIPGDPAVAMLGNEADPKLLEQFRRELGLDRPIHVRYFQWLGRVLRGDLGTSPQYQRQVSRMIIDRLPVTLQLALAAMIFAGVVGLAIGVLAALKPNSLADTFATSFAMAGIAMPGFWLGLLLILVFALYLRWLPALGYVPPLDAPVASFKATILPAVTLGLPQAAVIMRMTRSSLLEVLGQDYLRTARAKGLVESMVIRRHALANALIPVVTIVGLQVGRLIGGTVIIETVFAWPGVGRLAVDSIFHREFLVVQAVTLLVTSSVLFSNLAVDLLYAYLDPRIKYV